MVNFDAMRQEIEVIEFLYKNFPKLVTQLKQSTHSVNDTYEGTKQFHMEDSVWTHTMLVLHSAMFFNYDLEGILISLTHDFGKPISRDFKKDKYIFYNHGQMGTQIAADYLFAFQKQNSNLTDEMIKRILFVVSNHNMFFDCPVNKIEKFVNHDQKLFEVFKKHLLVDNIGRISSLEKFQAYVTMFNESDKFNFNVSSLPSNSFEKNIIFVCGSSNVGKDTFAKNNNLPVASFDKSRVEFYLNKNKIQDISDSKRIYKNAFQYASQNFDKILSHFYKNIDYLLKENNNIALCNTFCNKKNRTGILSTLKNKYRKENIGFHCKFILAESNFVISNSQNNKEKEVPIEVVKKFLKYQHLPTMLEGFDTVEIILNK